MFDWIRSQNDLMMVIIILIVGILSWIFICCMFLIYDCVSEWIVKKRKIARRKNELYRKYGNGDTKVYYSGVVRRPTKR